MELNHFGESYMGNISGFVNYYHSMRHNLRVLFFIAKIKLNDEKIDLNLWVFSMLTIFKMKPNSDGEKSLT